MTIERLEEIANIAKEGKPINAETIEILTALFISLYKHSTTTQELVKTTQEQLKEMSRKINALDIKTTLLEKQAYTPLYQLMVDENDEEREELLEYIKFVTQNNENPDVQEVCNRVFNYLTNETSDTEGTMED